MLKKLLLVTFLSTLTLCGCNGQDSETDETIDTDSYQEDTNDNSNAEENEISEDENTNTVDTESDENSEEMLYDYSNTEPLLPVCASVNADEKIWCVAYSDDKLLQTDLSGKIYNTFMTTDAMYAIAALPNNRIIFLKDEEYFIYDALTETDVTEEYTNGDKSIRFANNECLILSKTEETYNSQNIYITVLDNKGNEKISFSSNDINDKYNIEWDFDWGYGACGSHIYYTEIDSLGKNICFIDLERNKFYVSTNLPQSNMGRIFSDGEYIVDSQPNHGQAIINCDTEQVVGFKNGSYNIEGGLSDGKVYCADDQRDVKAYLNVDSSIALELNYEDTTVTDATQFENGYAMIEFNDKFVTIIDTAGNFLFEPVEGTVYKLITINDKNVYIFWKNQLYYLLFENGEISEPIGSADGSIYTISETGNDSLVVYDEGSFSFIPIE